MNLEPEFLVGIDPGIETMAICIYYPTNKSIRLFSGHPFDCFAFILKNELPEKAIFALEDPTKQNQVFNRRLPKSWLDFKIENQKAIVVGKLFGATMIIKEFLKRNGCKYYSVAPEERDSAKNRRKALRPIETLKSPTKTNKHQFKHLTGYSKRTNEHERDAATLVYGRTICWAETQLKIKPNQ